MDDEYANAVHVKNEADSKMYQMYENDVNICAGQKRMIDERFRTEYERITILYEELIKKHILDKTGDVYSDYLDMIKTFNEIVELQKFIKKNTFELTLLDIIMWANKIDYNVESDKMNNYHYIKQNYSKMNHIEIFKRIYNIFPFDPIMSEFLDFLFTIELRDVDKKNVSLYINQQYYTFQSLSDFLSNNNRHFKDSLKLSNYYEQNCEFVLKYLQHYSESF